MRCTGVTYHGFYNSSDFLVNEPQVDSQLIRDQWLFFSCGFLFFPHTFSQKGFKKPWGFCLISWIFFAGVPATRNLHLELQRGSRQR